MISTLVSVLSIISLLLFISIALITNVVIYASIFIVIGVISSTKEKKAAKEKLNDAVEAIKDPIERIEARRTLRTYLKANSPLTSLFGWKEP